MTDPSSPADRIPIITAESVLRRRPEMYFGARGPNPEIIAGSIAEGALVLGARRTLVAEVSGWWYVCADVDWFAARTQVVVDEHTVFQAMWGFPELGVNCCRWEVFARVFAKRTFSLSDDRVVRVKGDLPSNAELRALVASLGKWKRVVGFEFTASV